MIARIYHIAALLAGLIWLGSPPLSAQSLQPAPAQVAALKAAIQAARSGDWGTADREAQAGGDIAADILTWYRLRQGEGSFDEARAFLTRRFDWPGLKLLRRVTEKAIPRNGPPQPVLDFFAIQPPQTGRGALRYAEALRAVGREQAGQVLTTAWLTLAMDQEEHDAFVSRHGDLLRPYHWQRTDEMLWRGNLSDAERMLPLLTTEQAALARARMALRRNQNGVDALIAAVPGKLADDPGLAPGLAYERFLWRAAKGRNQDAADLLIERSASLAALGRPELWGSWRRVLARWAMREGKTDLAYRLASQHQLAEGNHFNDLEWLAGYIALRKLNDPALALPHFQRFRNSVYTPISLGRAGYWLGRTHEALGDAAQARKDYAFAANYQTSFYGQLAAERAGLPMDPALAGRERHRAYTQQGFWNSSVMRAARLLQAAGELYWTRRFTLQLAESLTRDEIGHLAGWAEKVSEPHLRVMLAKYAARQGWILHRPYFPTPDIGKGNKTVPRALELAIARRESEFNPEVVSNVGARGLMQLMPGTAKDMAKRLDMPFSRSRLTEDPAYNTRLGSEYLAKLIEDFDGNPVLIATAYNAGPSRTKQWVEQFGDPRAKTTDIVDWIEHIPFRETRNYVMRVTESLPIYRARLTGRTETPHLSQELKK